ncbi:hypothetical protein O9992_09620 [Vibrio lentus]|nr:hypothetical protein [Vibrio lentus]
MLRIVAVQEALPHEKGILQALKRWVEKHFIFTDQTGRKITPNHQSIRSVKQALKLITRLPR